MVLLLWLLFFKSVKSRPPSIIGSCTFPHLMECIPLLFLFPFQRKFLYNFSMCAIALDDTLKRERKYVGRLFRVAWISVSLPPQEILVPLQLLKCLSIFSMMGSQNVVVNDLPFKGRPRYVDDQEPTLQPKASAKDLIVLLSNLMPKNSDLE